MSEADRILAFRRENAPHQYRQLSGPEAVLRDQLVLVIRSYWPPSGRPTDLDAICRQAIDIIIQDSA